MKQAGVMASLLRSALITVLPLTFVILKQCNGSNSGSMMFEIPPDHQNRFILTDCKKTNAEDINCKCKSLGRDCRSNDTKYCKNCRCLSGQQRTFYIKKGNRALCLSTNNLLKAAGFGKPFLVYNYPGKVCARINETTKRALYFSKTCNSRDLRQTWVWTPDNLLMNIFNHRCLEVEGKIKKYRNIYLSRCNSSRNNQKWRCNNHLCFGISSEKIPTTFTYALRYNSAKPTLLAKRFSMMDVGILWTVYPEGNKSVCAARSPEGYFYALGTKTSPQFHLLPKCSKFGCSKVLSNSLNARNLTNCEILWEDSSWLDIERERRTFFNETQPAFAFKNYKDRLYFEWKFDPYSSLAGAFVNLTIECLVMNTNFQEFSFNFMIKEVIYKNVTEHYQFIPNNQSLTELNVTILNLNNGCIGSICSRQIEAPLRINKSHAVCTILWKESTFMKNGTLDWMNFDNMTGLFSLNNNNNSLRLQWKPTNISLLNKTTFNLTILCTDDQNENYTIAEKSQIIFQSVGKDIEGKSSSEKRSELLKIVLPVTLILFLLLVFLAVFCWCYYCRRKRRQPKSNKHSTSRANLQISMEADHLGARFNEGDDDPCYEDCRVTTHPSVTIARNQLYESTSFEESRSDSKIYEKPIPSVKLRRKIFEDDESAKTADHQPRKTPRSPQPKPKPREVKKANFTKARCEQEIPTDPRNNSQDEIYCEPLDLILDNVSPGVLEVPSNSPDNRLSSPYLKPLPASPKEDKANVYDYVTRVEIQKGITKSPKHHPDRKVFTVTAEEEHVGNSENYSDTNGYDLDDSHLYATLDHGD